MKPRRTRRPWPTSPSNSALTPCPLAQDMVELFRQELSLCRVNPSETVAVLTEGETRADYAQAFLAAAQQLGAQAFQVNVQSRPTHGGFAGNFGRTAIAGNRPVIEALKSADLVIDLMLLLFSQEQNEITAAGTRMLLVIEPIEVLSRLFPSESQRRRVEAGEARLSAARTMRITSPGRDRRHLPAGRLPGGNRVWLHRHPRALGPLALRFSVHRRR